MIQYCHRCDKDHVLPGPCVPHPGRFLPWLVGFEATLGFWALWLAWLRF